MSIFQRKRNKEHIYRGEKGNQAFLELFGLDKMKGTELDWIYKCSTHQIIFRDDLQTIRHTI